MKRKLNAVVNLYVGRGAEGGGNSAAWIKRRLRGQRYIERYRGIIIHINYKFFQSMLRFDYKFTFLLFSFHHSPFTAKHLFLSPQRARDPTAKPS